MAEREGFEPSVPLLKGTHDFQSCTFVHSVISPRFILLDFNPYNYSTVLFNFHGGESEIRTHEAKNSPTRFRGERFRPLSHLSALIPSSFQKNLLKEFCILLPLFQNTLLFYFLNSCYLKYQLLYLQHQTYRFLHLYILFLYEPLE